MVAADARAAARGLQRAPEVGEREGRDIARDAQLDRRVVEGVHRLAHLLEERVLPAEGRGVLVRVGVEAADLREENLALHIDAGCRVIDRFDQARDL